MTLSDFDSVANVSRDLAVVRWGRTWHVWDKQDAERGSHGAIIGPAHPSKSVAIAYALQRIAQGDYE